MLQYFMYIYRSKITSSPRETPSPPCHRPVMRLGYPFPPHFLWPNFCTAPFCTPLTKSGDPLSLCSSNTCFAKSCSPSFFRCTQRLSFLWMIRFFIDSNCVSHASTGRAQVKGTANMTEINSVCHFSSSSTHSSSISIQDYLLLRMYGMTALFYILLFLFSVKILGLGIKQSQWLYNDVWRIYKDENIFFYYFNILVHQNIYLK